MTYYNRTTSDGMVAYFEAHGGKLLHSREAVMLDALMQIAAGCIVWAESVDEQGCEALDVKALVQWPGCANQKRKRIAKTAIALCERIA